jgi:hypothetical protein
LERYHQRHPDSYMYYLDYHKLRESPLTRSASKFETRRF